MMCEDMTFCANECERKSCERHPSNIRHPRPERSFAYLKDTPYCDFYYDGGKRNALPATGAKKTDAG